MSANRWSTWLFAVLLFAAAADTASALPWDEDLFKQQSYKAGEMSRAPAEGTVPVGRMPFTMTTEEADTSLTNPLEPTKNSLWRGKRLYNVHCLPCHGAGAAGDGPVGPLMSVPSLHEDFYLQRTDGHSYGYIYHGGANMPRYGYKFSPNEIWDIINYLRSLQANPPADNTPAAAKANNGEAQ